MFLKSYINILLLLLIFSFSFSAFSQSDSIVKKNKVWQSILTDSKTIVKGVGYTFTQPLHWQKDDFITASAIITGTGILYLSDNKARDFFSKQEEHIPEVIKDFGFYFGKPQVFFIVSGGFYAVSLITDNEKVKHTSLLIFASAITGGAIQSISKYVVGRSRPNNGPHNEFKPFTNEAAYHSFPSGHAVLSFTMAHAIAKQFDNIWVKTGIYAIGSITPISRLWKEAHWISDVGVGIAISIITVDSMDNFLKGKDNVKDKNIKNPKQISWRFNAGYGTLGVVGVF